MCVLEALSCSRVRARERGSMHARISGDKESEVVGSAHARLWDWKRISALLNFVRECVLCSCVMGYGSFNGNHFFFF